MDDRLLNLPWQIQLALGTGYFAYLIACFGMRDHHKPADVTFGTMAFGLCAAAVLALPGFHGWPRVIAAGLAPILAALLWRLWLDDALRRLARAINLSWSDDTPSAWYRVTQTNRRHYVTQITVFLDDGSVLCCRDARQFAEAPYGPCVLGVNGDIAFYVTHAEQPGSGCFSERTGVRNPWYGDDMTYVPASRIREMRIRMLDGPTGSAPAAAEPPAEEAEVL